MPPSGFCEALRAPFPGPSPQPPREAYHCSSLLRIRQAPACAFNAAPSCVQSSCCISSYPRLQLPLAVELPAARRKALPSMRTAAGLVLQQMTIETPEPVSVKPKAATETGVARCPQSHAPRGFAGITPCVKTREPHASDNPTRGRGRPSTWLEGTPDQHL